MPRKARKTTNDLKTTSDLKMTSDHDVKDKLRQNTLVPINKLSNELFKRIFRLACPEPWVSLTHYQRLDYLPYTWVCHHWRSVLVQIPEFWTKIRIRFGKNPMNPVIIELLKRSGSANLDVEMHIDYSTSILENFLAKESTRIHTLSVTARDSQATQRTFAGKQFPLLRRVVCDDLKRGAGNSVIGLLPLIGASEHLYTLKCHSWDDFPVEAINQLAPALGRISKLSLTIRTSEILHSVLDVLHNKANLHTLELLLVDVPPTTFSKQTILPGLQFLTTDTVFLLDGIQAPKLSSLDIQCTNHSVVVFKNPSILQQFGASEIKYLQITDREDGGHTIFGLKAPILSKTVLLLKCGVHSQVSFFVLRANETTFIDDYLSDPWMRDYLRLNFILDDIPFRNMLKSPLYPMLPQLTGLLELCLASDQLYYEDISIRKILAKVPSLEILIVLHNETEDGLMEFIPHLGNTLLCPRLKHLSYISRKLGDPNMADDVGRLLTKSLRSRHKVHGPVLKDIVFGHCPPLSDTWLEEIQKLGATVVTNKDAKNYNDKDPQRPSAVIWGIQRGFGKDFLFDWGPRIV